MVTPTSEALSATSLGGVSPPRPSVGKYAAAACAQPPCPAPAAPWPPPVLRVSISRINPVILACACLPAFNRLSEDDAESVRFPATSLWAHGASSIGVVQWTLAANALPEEQRDAGTAAPPALVWRTHASSSGSGSAFAGTDAINVTSYWMPSMLILNLSAADPRTLLDSSNGGHIYRMGYAGSVRLRCA